jgi:hypothetical protein
VFLQVEGKGAEARPEYLKNSMTEKPSQYISRGAEARTISVKSIEGKATYGG